VYSTTLKYYPIQNNIFEYANYEIIHNYIMNFNFINWKTFSFYFFDWSIWFFLFKALILIWKCLVPILFL